ncbi:MAG TPA: hypothetical protein VF894_07410 [Anaeromyxobacter sp.]
MIAALAIALPFDTAAKPSGQYSLIVQSDGDQTDPSIDSEYIVYASNASGDWDILLYTIGGDPLIQVVAGGPGDQDQPDVNRTTLAYRVADGIVLRNWEFGNVLRAPPPREPPPAVDPTKRCQGFDPVSQPVVTNVLATWTCGIPGSRSIQVARYAGGVVEYELADSASAAGAGDQFGAAAFQQYVAFVDGADGDSVWLHDASSGTATSRRVCGGHATGVAVGTGETPVLAVTRSSSGHDADVEVWDAEGQLVTTLRVEGVQQNPHISSDWVAFEDLSTGHAQVVLWQWTTGLVFVPNPSKSNQTLNDLGVVAGAEVRVVFADDVDGSGGNRDIALYRLAYVNGAIPDDGTGDGNPWLPPPPPPPAERPAPARCDDADPTVLGTIELGRDPGKPLAATVSFDATPFPGDADLPVLVCIDSVRVTAGWVTLDDAAIANPGDFNPAMTHLEVRAVAEAGSARIAGTIAGKPGTWLVARILADPGRTTPPATTPFSAGTRIATTAVATLSAGSLHGGGAGGCGTGGGAGPLAGLALLLALRSRRR